jgi:hypothetical protein
VGHLILTNLLKGKIMALMQSTDLIKKIGSIGKASAKLTRDIQTVAVQAIGYSIEFGDVTIGQRLYDALGTAVRRQSLVSFFEKYGQFCWSSVEKKFVYFKVDGIEFDEKTLMATPWNEAKKEVIVSEVDAADMVAKLIKRLESSIEKHVTVKHSALLDDLKIMYSQYLQDEAEESEVAED